MSEIVKEVGAHSRVGFAVGVGVGVIVGVIVGVGVGVTHKPKVEFIT